MEINRINNINTKNYYSTKNKTSENLNTQSDNIQISESAKKKIYEVKLKSEAKKITEEIINSPVSPSRQTKINQIKEKLESGFYDNLSMEILNKTADEIISSLFSNQK